jgi:sugar phosphate isomerase/epimerase
MNNPIAVSTWSLHHHLGYSCANGPADPILFVRSPTWGDGAFGLLQLPQELAKRDYHSIEICHFHVESLDIEYLRNLREAFQQADVTIQTLLIDDGDITHPATRDRDIKWIKTWIDAAAVLGAEHARVVAGKSLPNAQSLGLSVSGLQELFDYGAHLGVKIVTENWFDLLSTPDAVHHALDRVPHLGFMADTGNWHGPTKHADLTSIFARATLCHAKASFDQQQVMDMADFAACLSAAKHANYSGPMTLIFDGAGDEWTGLAQERKFLENF